MSFSNTEPKNKKTKKHLTFGFKCNTNAKEYEKAIVRKHRNTTPFFRLNFQNREFAYTQKVFLDLSSKHDLSRNRYLNALRIARYQRETIRKESREVMEVLIPTLISYCDMNLNSEFLFEVQANVEHIAKMCNQTYEYKDSNGYVRVRYDTITNALNTFDEAGLITILREKDKVSGKNKAMRIWLNPEFFLMLGVSLKELRRKLLKYHKYQYQNNNLDKTRAAYQKHLMKIEHKNIASMKSNYKLRSLLLERKKNLLGEKTLEFVKQRKPINYRDFDIESDIFKPCFRTFEDCNTPEEIEKLRQRLYMRSLLREQARTKAQNNKLYKQELERYYAEQYIN
ncbi:RepA family replication protein [Pasteurella multocida]|uniref:RepA family replication protein n=1 Tax=Pasteurella multocida TaxID=747 RepID=UPI002FE2954D